MSEKAAVMEIEEYLAPRTLEEAVRIAAAERAVVLAGGTDSLPRWSRGLARRPRALVDVKKVEGLEGVARANGEARLGACTTLSAIASDPIIREAAPMLALAASRVACPQVRNRATIGGNLCNASPAADTAVPLILLDAVLELASGDQDRLSVREVPVADFFCGPGSTVLAPGEILTQVRFKPLADGWFWAWDKFGTRPAMEIAVASVGVVLGFEGCTVAHARVGYGSVAPTPLRGRGVEAELTGRSLCDGVIDKCQAAARAEITPITDVRAGEAYRRELVALTLRRMLERAARG